MHNSFLKHLLLLIIISFTSICTPSFAANQVAQSDSVQQKLAALEKASGGRLGIYALNTANNTHIGYRANERFPFCSTSKVMVVSAILKQSMTNDDLLQEKISYQKNDITSYSPITKKHVSDGMTISELAAAAISYSDSTAMNLLTKKAGGTQAITSFARSIGDNEFRLDRLEPALNTAIPGDPRDTTTPIAMATTLQKLVLGDALGATQRTQLQTWLKDNTTGGARIRAGVPKGWIVGDKTGTGDYGTTNDIGIIWPAHGAPIVVAIYFTHNHKDAKSDDKVIVDATRILIDDETKV